MTPEQHASLKEALDLTFGWINAKNSNAAPISWAIHIPPNEIILDVDANFISLHDHEKLSFLETPAPSSENLRKSQKRLALLNGNLSLLRGGQGGTRIRIQIPTDDTLPDLSEKIKLMRAELQTQLKYRSIPIGF